MTERMKKLSDAELEIMLVLWQAEGPVTSGQVRDALRGKRDWALSTLMSALDKLGKHGFVHCDRSTRTNLYSPAIGEGEYKAWEGKTFLEKLYGSSLKNLVTSLYEEEALSEGDLAELERYLTELKERK